MAERNVYGPPINISLVPLAGGEGRDIENEGLKERPRKKGMGEGMGEGVLDFCHCFSSFQSILIGNKYFFPELSLFCL